MTKKITIKNPKSKPETAEAWVSKRDGIKRLTIDIPLSLHAKLKITSAKQGQTMADLVKECLTKYFKEE